MRGQIAVVEDRVARLAGKQHGVVAFWQLIALGLGADAIQYRVKIGRLHRVYRAVYAVGHRALSREGRDMAAVLACGEGAVLSHWSAAARWELLRPQGNPCVTSGRRLVIKAIDVRMASLHPDECTTRDRIPTTSVPRTLLDLAGVANERILRRAINEAARRKRLDTTAIADLLERHPRQKGSRALRSFIAAVDPQTHRTRSDLEVAFLKFCQRHSVDTPVVNGELGGYEVDMHWPGRKLIVELDDYEYHRTPAEFENDRRRDAQLKSVGYTVIRVTGTWLDEDPPELVELLRMHVGVDRVF